MKEFYFSEEREPHHGRRKEILSEHPEVRKLFLKDSSLAPKLIFAVSLQLCIAACASSFPWWGIALLSMTIGSTLSHILFLGIHELSHELAFRKKVNNDILALVTNVPVVFPYAMAFKVYHLDHHWHQGVKDVDVDIPSEQEALLFKGKLGKFIWLLNQILFYALRPIFVRPIKMTKWQLYNILFQLICMIGLVLVFGWVPILYLLTSLFFSGGLHPIAGHFISEHYVFKKGQETYSYYGFWNKLTFNVGYHNEHHDFPNVPGKYLPEVKQIALKHYENLYSYSSWSSVLFSFVRSNSVSLFSRVKRTSR